MDLSRNLDTPVAIQLSIHPVLSVFSTNVDNSFAVLLEIIHTLKARLEAPSPARREDTRRMRQAQRHRRDTQCGTTHSSHNLADTRYSRQSLHIKNFTSHACLRSVSPTPTLLTYNAVIHHIIDAAHLPFQPSIRTQNSLASGQYPKRSHNAKQRCPQPTAFHLVDACHGNKSAPAERKV